MQFIIFIISGRSLNLARIERDGKFPPQKWHNNE